MTSTSRDIEAQKKLTTKQAIILLLIPTLAQLSLLGIFFTIIITNPNPLMLTVALLLFAVSVVSIVLQSVAIRRLSRGWVALGVILIMLSCVSLLFGAGWVIFPYVIDASLSK